MIDDLNQNIHWDLAWENLLEVRRSVEQCLRLVRLARQMEDPTQANDELMRDWIDMFPATQDQIDKMEDLYIDYATRLRQNMSQVADNEIK